MYLNANRTVRFSLAHNHYISKRSGNNVTELVKGTIYLSSNYTNGKKSLQ